MVKAGSLILEMQQCGYSGKARLREAAMWLKQEG